MAANSGNQDDVSSNEADALIDDPNFKNSFRMLLWKDYKQQTIRRPISTGCRMLLPVLFIALLGLIRGLYDVTTFSDGIWDINEQDWYTAQRGSDEYYSDPIPSLSSDVYSGLYWKEELLCKEDIFYNFSLAPYMIAFVPNPEDGSDILSGTALEYYKSLIDVLNVTWQVSTAELPDGESLSDVNWKLCPNSYEYLPFLENWLVRYFDSESELEDYVKSRDYGNGYNVSSSRNDHRPIAFSIVINSISDDGFEWDYTLRMNTSDCANTNDKIDKFTREYRDLYWESIDNYWRFMVVQDWVDRAIHYITAEESGSTDNEFAPYLEKSNGTSWGGYTFADGYRLLIDYDYTTFPFPLKGFKTDAFWTDFGALFFFFVLVQFVYPINVIVTVLVNEKAAKIAEGLKMMGATLASYWASWILWFFIEMAIVSLLIALSGAVFQVFKYSDIGVIFMYFWPMTLSLSGMSMLISTIFDNPKIASLFACTIWIITLLLGGFGSLMTESGKGWFCLIAPACINMSLNNLSVYESSLLGLQWDNIDESYDDFRFSTAMIMFWVDYILYVILALYCDRTIPSRYGSRLPFYFICMSSFWKKKEVDTSRVEIAKQFTEMDLETYEDTKDKYANSQPSIAIRQLRKHFEPLFKKSGSVVKAVNGVSLNMYEGEVFCLLGHNGAGKTTTIGMLTGLLDVTEGDAYILGNSVTDSMANARKFMHDVLFPLLNCQEHLRMYARLKGVRPEFVDKEVERTLKDIGLESKARSYPTQLSGGQKRKLSLGIAFIGQSKIVFLDEPTSGMDPQARRVTWELIAKEKQNRTIILTTHYMDEADFLGDRIAIMSGGKVKCCGSSLFLKRLYGVGYTFTVSLKIGVKPIDVKNDIDNVVLKHVPKAQVLSISGAEMNYRLPFSDSGSFPNMFEELDGQEEKNNIGINSYGVSVTTLEEVFLKIGHDDNVAVESQVELKQRTSVQMNSDEQKNDNGGYNTVDVGKQNALTGDNYDNPFPQPTFKLNIGDDSSIGDKIQKELLIFIYHCYAVLYRRFWWSIRDSRGICCQLLIPGCLAAMGLGVLQIFFSESYPALELSVEKNFYSPANEYGVPISDISGISATQTTLNSSIFTTGDAYLSMDDWTSAWDDDGMVDNFGELQYYVVTDLSDGSEFTSELLDHASDTKDFIHYYGFAVDENGDWSVGLNVSAYHSWPISMNAFRNWIGKTKFDSRVSISITSHPLPTTTTEDAFNDFIFGLMASLYLLLAFAFVPVGAVYQVVMDKTTLTKHQQFVSGMSLFSYWIGNYIADILNSLPAGLIVVLQVYIFDTESFKGEAAGPFMLSILLFIFSITPFTYLLSFLFKNPSGAQRWTAILYIILGIVLLIVSWILDLTGVKVNEDLKPIYQIFPTYLMSEAVYGIALRDVLYPDTSYYSNDVIGEQLTKMLGEGFGYFALLLLIEWMSHQPQIMQFLGLIPNVPHEEEELDEDVAKEQERIKAGVVVETGGSGTIDVTKVPDSVVLAGLRRVYNAIPNKNVAVKDVWFGVPQGQVFGFLGVNGAGKTTTLACLTGERHCSSGTGFIHGYPITQQSIIRRFIGYCPQFDALFELLTGEEHLRFYGTLKGLKGDELDDQIEMLLNVLSLQKYRNRRAGTYSGGNKRKLSVAMSMIGNPPIVEFLTHTSLSNRYRLVMVE